MSDGISSGRHTSESDCSQKTQFGKAGEGPRATTPYKHAHANRTHRRTIQSLLKQGQATSIEA